MTDGVANKSIHLELIADIVSAFVSNNSVGPTDLPALIQSVHEALLQLSSGVAAAVPRLPEPAVSIKKSISPDYLICLDDGLKFKSLKRHLGQLGMTPEQYREKWGLPSDYSMVASNYAKKRSELAKTSGLGRDGSLRKKTTTAKT